MSKTSLFAAVLVMAASGLAHAGGQAGSLGVGAEFELNGAGGVSVNYDAGPFHVGGLFGFYDPDRGDNTFNIGARFFYHVHSTAMSDFGLGGNFGVISEPRGYMMRTDRTTDIYLEPGFQVRLFLASNVALSFTGGFVLGIGETRDTAITGSTGFNAGAGVHYYFF